MAPELMSAEHPELARPAVDVYSFGVVLHYIITGEESDRRSMARAIRYGTIYTVFQCFYQYTYG
jgi:hypothetical protein